MALQETWLLPHDVSILGTIDQDFAYTGKSAVDTSAGMLRGRPYGGLAILWRKSVFRSVSIIDCVSARISAIQVVLEDRQFLVFSIYMPTYSAENLAEFTGCLSEISAVIDSCNIDSVFMLGDFNAQPSAPFGKELMNFCTEQSWECAGIDVLGLSSGTYTFVSDAHASWSWLDHVVTTETAREAIVDIKINYNISWSDHFAVEINCNLNVIKPKVIEKKSVPNTVVWGERDTLQSKQYWKLCSSKLREIVFLSEFSKCADISYDTFEHRCIIDNMYNTVVRILRDSAAKCHSLNAKKGKRKAQVTGWNKFVAEAHREARLWFQEWVSFEKPSFGSIYHKMRDSRNNFKSKLKWCQNNQT